LTGNLRAEVPAMGLQNVRKKIPQKGGRSRTRKFWEKETEGWGVKEGAEGKNFDAEGSNEEKVELHLKLQGR